jgi:hypothetical protein
MVIRGEDMISRHTVGDFEGRWKRPAKDAID